MNSGYSVERFLDYVRTSRSKNTLTMYRQGLKRFTEWYGKTANEILAERVKDWTSGDLFQKKRFAREIEKYHAYLIKEKGYAPNSATYYCQGVRSLFSFYEMPVKVSSEIDRRKMTTRDYVPRIDHYAEMLKFPDNLRDKLIVSMGLTLAWRISDFAKIKKTDLPNLELEPPIPFEILTQKEETLAKSFLSDEAVGLLKEYLPTLSEENPYLFPSNGSSHLDHTTFNRIVRDLAERAKIRVPRQKRIRFHCFRKRFLSESANLRIDVNIAKLLTGKAVEAAMLAYLSETDLKSAFERISERLRLTEKKTSVKTTKEAAELQKQIDELKKLVHGIAALHGDQLVKNAAETLGMKPQDLWMRANSLEEIIKMVADKEWEKQKKEYQKIVAENGNNDP